MPAYVDTMTFGGQMLELRGKAANEWFAGATYTTSTKGLYNAVGGTDGIDLGAIVGNYKDRYHLRVLVCSAFAGTSAANVVLNFYSSSATTKKCAASDKKMTLTVPVATFNKCTQSPYEISLPPDVARYNTLGITLTNAAGEAVAITSGSLIATIEDKRW